MGTGALIALARLEAVLVRSGAPQRVEVPCPAVVGRANSACTACSWGCCCPEPTDVRPI